MRIQTRLLLYVKSKSLVAKLLMGRSGYNKIKIFPSNRASIVGSTVNDQGGRGQKLIITDRGVRANN